MHAWTFVLTTHVLAALLALPLGGYQLIRRPRGDARHRFIGRVWVIAMLYVAVSSFWLNSLTGGFSFLHVLSCVTIVSIVAAFISLRLGNVRGHVGSMTGSYLGLLGAFTAAVAIPSRAVPTFAVANPLDAALVAFGVLAVSAGFIAAGTWMTRPRTTNVPAA